MAIASISIPVPSSGDGPVVNISNLVGQKTIELTGVFQGQYVLLGGHAADKLVPIVQFDAGGPEGIKQTLDEAYQFVAVRAQAVAGSVITMSVAGIVGAGQNHFGSLATLNPGDTGPQPIIDTATLFPPTGLEQAINIICEGDFEGPIVIEGSIDGTDFSPIGQFVGYPRGRTLIGLAKPLEFGPLPTEDKTRYIRINVGANIKSITNLTIGGQISAGGGGAGETVSLMTNDTDAFGFLGQGLGSTAPLPTDAAGNSVVTLFDPLYFPNQVVLLGANNTVRFTGAPMVVMGYGNTSGANYSVVVGANNTTADNSSGIVSLGIDMILGVPGGNDNCNFNTAIGVRHAIHGTCAQNVMIGYQHNIGQDGGGANYNILIGQRMNIGGGAPGLYSFANVLISGEGGGHNLNNSQWNNVLGYGFTGNNLFYCNMVGTFSEIKDNCNYVNLMGFANTVGLGAQKVIVVGDNCSTVSDNVENFVYHGLVGSNIVVSNPSAGTGYSSNIAAWGDHITLVATNDPSYAASDFNRSIAQIVAVGSTITATTRFSGADFGSNLVLIGTNIRSGLADASGRGTNNNIFVGYNISVDDEGVFNTAIGNNIQFAAQNQRNVVIAGIGGAIINVNGSRNVIIGQSPSIGALDNDVVCIGSNPDYTYVAVGTNCSGAICISGKVLDDAGPAVAIGYQAIAPVANTIHISSGGSNIFNPGGAIHLGHVVIGNAIDCQTQNSTNLVLIGSGLSVTNLLNGTLIGQNNSYTNTGDGYGVVVVGDYNGISNASQVTVVGRGSTFANLSEGIAIGHNHTIGASSIAVAIGRGCTISTTNNLAIAIGLNATATDNQCIIGNSNTSRRENAIHYFAVEGFNPAGGGGLGANIITFAAYDNSLGLSQLGLTVTFNDAGNIVNKNIFADVIGSLPVGAKVLFMS